MDVRALHSRCSDVCKDVILFDGAVYPVVFLREILKKNRCRLPRKFLSLRLACPTLWRRRNRSSLCPRGLVSPRDSEGFKFPNKTARATPTLIPSLSSSNAFSCFPPLKTRSGYFPVHYRFNVPFEVRTRPKKASSLAMGTHISSTASS